MKSMDVHRFRLLDSESLLSSLLIIPLKSITRASFRRSSVGLQSKLYFCPLSPMSEIFFGRTSELITSTSSLNSIQQYSNKKGLRQKLTQVSERVVREDVLAKRIRFVEKGRWSPLLEQS
jgi:hypothetical protein